MIAVARDGRRSYGDDMTQSPVALYAASPVELKERLEAERRGAPFVVFRDSAGRQHIVELADDASRLTIGRRPDSDVALMWDGQVSRVHAELQRVGSDWVLVDDGLSRNGSYVNGERVAGRCRLRDGDTVRVGETLLVYAAPAAGGGSRVTDTPAEIPTVADLSETQLAVLRALCRPFRHAGAFSTPATNQQIAEEVFLSVDAVKTHLRALFAKFGVQDFPQNQKRAQLVARAFKTGIVSERDL